MLVLSPVLPQLRMLVLVLARVLVLGPVLMPVQAITDSYTTGYIVSSRAGASSNVKDSAWGWGWCVCSCWYDSVSAIYNASSNTRASAGSVSSAIASASCSDYVSGKPAGMHVVEPVLVMDLVLVLMHLSLSTDLSLRLPRCLSTQARPPHTPQLVHLALSLSLLSLSLSLSLSFSFSFSLSLLSQRNNLQNSRVIPWNDMVGCNLFSYYRYDISHTLSASHSVTHSLTQSHSLFYFVVALSLSLCTSALLEHSQRPPTD